MKVLHPRLTVALASHLRPAWLPSSLDSILAQTRLDVQVIVCDSGEWIQRDDEHSLQMRNVYDRYSQHPLIEWWTLGELPGLRDRTCPHSYTMNRIFGSGEVRGRYVCVFTDDDLYRPRFVEVMAGFLDERPEHRAVWCSQDRIRVDTSGTITPAKPTILATAPKHGAQFDQVVDMLQLVFHRDVLDELESPWFDENVDPARCRHSDGVFMDRVGELVGVVPNVDEVLVTHRYTPDSYYN